MKDNVLLFAVAFFVSYAVSVIKEHYLSEEAPFMATVLSVSLIAHYIWLRCFVRSRIRAFGLPDLSELLNLGFNLYITVSVSIDIRRWGITGSQSRFLPDWAAMWYLGYCGVVLLNHVFDRLVEWGCPRRRRPIGLLPIDRTTVAAAAEFPHLLDFAGNLRYRVRVNEV